jgi:hypothetical protein
MSDLAAEPSAAPEAEPQEPPGKRSALTPGKYYAVGFVPLGAILVLGYLSPLVLTTDGLGPRFTLNLVLSVLLAAGFAALLFQESWRSRRHRVRSGVLSLTVVLVGSVLTGLTAALGAVVFGADHDFFGGPDQPQPALAAGSAVLALIEFICPPVGGIILLAGRSRTTFVVGSVMVVVALVGRIFLDGFLMLSNSAANV